MTPCSYCGDLHGPRDLCQRAQRGLSRRSFCFLFGAGVAGLALAPANALGWSNLHAALIRADILQHLFDPTEMTFTTRDLSLRAGHTINIDLPHCSFRGVIDRIEHVPASAMRVHATAPLTAEIIERRDAYPWLAAGRPIA